MVQIINYGLGNLGSVANMLKRINVECCLVTNPKELIPDKIILPGVGSFDTGMENLTKGDWVAPLSHLVLEKKVPVLGICLGMQLMTNSSEEGNMNGLGWIDASVLKFSSPNLKVPHMGWNIVTPSVKNLPSILDNTDDELRYYFVHSFYVHLKDSSEQIGETVYGNKFTSVFQKENIFGVQFHPEKSHRFGMTLLKKFGRL